MKRQSREWNLSWYKPQKTRNNFQGQEVSLSQSSPNFPFSIFKIVIHFGEKITRNINFESQSRLSGSYVTIDFIWIILIIQIISQSNKYNDFISAFNVAFIIN